MAPSTAADTRVTVGRRLRQERERQDLSQTQVAAKAGTDQKVVSRAENGKATLETQLHIGAVLGLDAAALL